MQGPIQGLSSNLLDCPLTVNSQIHKQERMGRVRGRKTQLTQVKQHLTGLTKN